MFFDELDTFLDGVRTGILAHSEEKPPEEDDIIDELLDLYLLAYFEGSQDAAKELMIDTEPSVEAAEEAINRPVAGKTFQERVREYLSGNGDVSPAEGIVRLADTDSVRIYNEAKLTTATANGATKKTWRTMEDFKVRDTHRFLQDMTVPIDARFYTYDGDSAPAPAQFSLASNNVNCRCWLEFSK